MNHKAIAGAGLIAFAALLILVLAPQSQEKGIIQIGVIAPLTGPGASLGEWMIDGVTFAQEEINAKGGINGKRVELVIEDDKCNGKSSVDAYNKLRTQNIVYFIGPLCGAARVPVLEVAEREETVLITTGLALDTAPKTSAHTFNVLPSAWSVAQKIVEFAAAEGYTVLSVLYSDDEYGKENDLAIKQYAEQHNLKLISVEKHARGSVDLRTQILKFKNDESQAVVAAAFGPEYAVFLKQASELDLNKPIFAVSSIQVPEAAIASQQTEEKVFYSYPSVSNLDSVVAFAEKFRLEDKDASLFLPMYIGAGYDALTLLVGALDTCGINDQSCVNETLAATEGYKGANGLVSFDVDGNNLAESSMEVRTLYKGEFAQYVPE